MGLFTWQRYNEVPHDEDDVDGVLLLFEEPLAGFDYFIGVDVGSGQGLTNSVLHVLRRGNNGPDVQVAEWASRLTSSHDLPKIINEVGGFFKCTRLDLPACVCIEMNNLGEAVNYELMTYFMYPHIYTAVDYDSRLQRYVNRVGFWTSQRTRKDIIFWGKKALEQGSWIVHSPWFINEMASFTTKRALEVAVIDEEAHIVKEMEEAESARHARGKKDDRLMAGFIAEKAASESRVDVHPSMMPKVVGEVVDPSAPKRDYRNTMITAADMKKELSKGFKRW